MANEERRGPRARAKAEAAARYAAEVSWLFDHQPEHPDVRVPCICGVEMVYPGQKCRECATKAVAARLAERKRIAGLPGVGRKK